MSDGWPPDDDLEARISRLESRVNDLQDVEEPPEPTPSQIRAEMEHIQRQQAELRRSMESLADQLSETQARTPTAESLEDVVDWLQQVEETMGVLSDSVATLEDEGSE